VAQHDVILSDLCSVKTYFVFRLSPFVHLRFLLPYIFGKNEIDIEIALLLLLLLLLPLLS